VAWHRAAPARGRPRSRRVAAWDRALRRAINPAQPALQAPRLVPVPAAERAAAVRSAAMDREAPRAPTVRAVRRAATRCRPRAEEPPLVAVAAAVVAVLALVVVAVRVAVVVVAAAAVARRNNP